MCAVVAELHEGHPGIARMKSLARMYVWWPSITKDIEEAVRGCAECQLHQAMPPPAPLYPWSWPSRPWARLHLDYAGPVQGKMFLVLIDAHSKWIEAFCTPNATSSTVIEELRTTFARFGLPETVVTDNGTCFVSAEFEAFLEVNGIKHITSAPYHPASNGLAERAVQIVKKGLKKITSGRIRDRLAKILMPYRLTPQSTTGISPAELLLGRRPRSRLDCIKPHTAERVESKQLRQKEQHDARAVARKLEIGERVFVRNYVHGDKWLPGVVSRQTGPVSFVVTLSDGQERRVHQDQIRTCTVDSRALSEVSAGTAVEESTPDLSVADPVELPALIPDSVSTPTDTQEPPVTSPVASGEATGSSGSSQVTTPPVLKPYPKRTRVARRFYEPKW